MNQHPTLATKRFSPPWLGTVLIGLIAQGPEAYAAGVQIDADGRLSVEVRDADPVAVMRQIAKQARFKLVVSEGVQAIPGSWSFNGIPMEAGIGRLLGNVDYILVQQSGADSDPGIDRVWILSKSTPVTSVSVSLENEEASAADSSAADSQESWQEALRTIAETAKSSDPNRTQNLLAYVDHSDRRVRHGLARALGQVGDQEAVLALGQLIFGDAEATVRRAAATALGKNQSAEAIQMLRSSLEDKDPRVKQHVSRILANIDDN